MVGAVLFASTQDISSIFSGLFKEKEVPAVEDKMVDVGIGETKTEYGLSITPLEVLEDSRCPANVQCIQAGIVRLRVTIKQGDDESRQEFELGRPFLFLGGTVVLTSVTPAPIAGEEIAEADYRFIFATNPSNKPR